jgi:hypothetical protein
MTVHDLGGLIGVIPVFLLLFLVAWLADCR